MRKTLSTFMLILTLSCSVYAGEIPTPPAVPQSACAAPETTEGEIPTPLTAVQVTIGVVLNVLTLL